MVMELFCGYFLVFKGIVGIDIFDNLFNIYIKFLGYGVRVIVGGKVN